MQKNQNFRLEIPPDDAVLMMTRTGIHMVREHGAFRFSLGLGDTGHLVVGADVPLDADAARALVSDIETKAELDGYFLHGSIGEEQATPFGTARSVIFIFVPCAPELVH